MKLTLGLIILLLVISCTKTLPLKIGNGEDVIVTLILSDLENLVDISASSNNLDTTLYPKDLKSFSVIHFKFNLNTEKSYYIGATTKKDTFGILTGAQSGDRPILLLNEDTLKYLDIGIY